MASGVCGEILKYQSRNRKSRGGVIKTAQEERWSLCLISFQALHNVSDKSEQFLYIRQSSRSNGASQVAQW